METALLLFGLSLHHPDNLGDRDWANPGLGVVVQQERARLLAGAFRNSEGQFSAFAGGGGEIPITDNTGVTLAAVLVSGYEPIPVVAPLLTVYIDHGACRWHAAAIPDAVALFLEYRL